MDHYEPWICIMSLYVLVTVHSECAANTCVVGIKPWACAKLPSLAYNRFSRVVRPGETGEHGSNGRPGWKHQEAVSRNHDPLPCRTSQHKWQTHTTFGHAIVRCHGMRNFTFCTSGAVRWMPSCFTGHCVSNLMFPHVQFVRYPGLDQWFIFLACRYFVRWGQAHKPFTHEGGSFKAKAGNSHHEHGHSKVRSWLK